jgi:EmrB/QacA subfamily drug resistance transporter
VARPAAQRLDVGARSVPRPITLATLLAVLFLTFLDTTIVTVALGAIHYDLGSGVIPLQWVVSAYSLVFASLMLTAGSLSDRLGRKWLLLGGLAVFCAGSVLCALAPNAGTLIAGRAVMGAGAAASEPGTLSVLRQLYPVRAERARAIGAWAAVSGLALALGPVIGGLLVAGTHWRSVFWFNLVLGLLLLLAAWAFVPNSADPPAGRLDVEGFALGALTLAGVTFAGISGEQHGYGTWWVLLLFAVSAAALIGLVAFERRAANPMLELGYLKSPVVSSALFVAFAVYFGVFAIFVFTTLYLDLVVGYSGWRLAASFTPMAAAIVVGSVLSGHWVGRVGTRWPMIAGCLVSAVGILSTRQHLGPHPSFGWLSVALAVTGVGFGLAVVPLTDAVLGHVPAALSGMAASATNTARQVGAVIGVAALGALVNSHITGDFSDRLQGLGVSGTGKNFIIGLLETGGDNAKSIDLAHPPAIIKPLVDAGTAAFLRGVQAALVTAAVLILIAAVVLAVGLRSSRSDRPGAAVGP